MRTSLFREIEFHRNHYNESRNFWTLVYLEMFPAKSAINWQEISGRRLPSPILGRAGPLGNERRGFGSKTYNHASPVSCVHH